MEACEALRAQLRERASHTAPPSRNDFVVKACGLALREHPRVNGFYRDARFELHERVNVGVAVAAEDALVVPTIFDAHRKSLGTIAGEARWREGSGVLYSAEMHLPGGVREPVA
jgi:pyruvate dehydrogenase E2 component (dihydrolipoamide acetyltransferase)